MKAGRFYILTILFFMGVFVYETVFVLPHRPATPDPAHNFTFPLGLDESRSMVRYISPLDSLLTFGPFFCAFIMVWRVGKYPGQSDDD